MFLFCNIHTLIFKYYYDIIIIFEIDILGPDCDWELIFAMNTGIENSFMHLWTSGSIQDDISENDIQSLYFKYYKSNHLDQDNWQGVQRVK